MPKQTKPGVWPYDEAAIEILGRIVVHWYLFLPGNDPFLDQFIFVLPSLSFLTNRAPYLYMPR